MEGERGEAGDYGQKAVCEIRWKGLGDAEVVELCMVLVVGVWDINVGIVAVAEEIISRHSHLQAGQRSFFFKLILQGSDKTRRKKS